MGDLMACNHYLCGFAETDCPEMRHVWLENGIKKLFMRDVGGIQGWHENCTIIRLLEITWIISQLGV
jgi:hypothetical protein